MLAKSKDVPANNGNDYRQMLKKGEGFASII